MPLTRSAFVLLLLSCSARAGGLPEPVVPQGVGVNIHFTRGHSKDLDMIAAAGFKVVRMDFTWTVIERTKGAYDWSVYDELTADLDKRGLRAIYILDYSNGLYESAVVTRDPVSGREERNTASPQHPESVAAFARWAAAAAQHFRGRRVIWEIWNEPNITFWKPKPDVRQYTALALAAARAIHEADPRATLVGPATSEVALPFLESFFAAGALAHLDAVSVHPYRDYARPPETAAEDYRKLRSLIERHAPDGKKKLPILSGEWGYASHTKGVSPQTQAAYLVRQQLANLHAGVPLSVWYDWKDDGADPAEREHNFGIVRHDQTPKPAYVAAKTLARELTGYRIERRLDTGVDRDYVLMFIDTAGHRKLVAWTLGEPHAVTLGGLRPAGRTGGTTLTGEPFAPRVAKEGLAVDLTAAPQYVTLDGGAP
jgi:hypothetical protein